MNQSNFYLLISSIFGSLLITLSPAKDMITYLTLQLGFILVLIAQIITYDLDPKREDYKNVLRGIRSLSLIGVFLTILGMFVGSFEAPPIPGSFIFRYYFIVAFFITVNLILTVRMYFNSDY